MKCHLKLKKTSNHIGRIVIVDKKQYQYNQGGKIMDIERKTGKINFEDLEYGDVFDISGTVCMKTEGPYNDCNAVDLKTGKIREVQDQTLVNVLRANLIVR